METILLFRTTDAPALAPGTDALLQALRASSELIFEEEQGSLGELLQLQPKGFVLLAISPAQLPALSMLPAALAHRLFLLGCGNEALPRLEQLQIAGALPDPAYRLPNGKWLACGHAWPAENVQDAGRRLSARYSFLHLSAEDPARELRHYFELYERLQDQLWIETPAPPAEPRATERKRSYELKSKDDWYERLSRVSEQSEKLRSEAKPGEEFSPASERHAAANDEAENELRLLKILREAALAPAFRAKADVRAAAEKKDIALLTALLETELAKAYVRERFVGRGWEDLKFWTNVRFLQQVGSDRNDVHPDEIGERKVLVLENNTKWVEVAAIDLMLTKTLMRKYDPEVMLLMQNRRYAQGEEAMEHLLKQVRQCLKKMSTSNYAMRILSNGRRIDNLNVSYWGNERPVTLALRAGQDGWTDSLPFTDGEINALAEELLQPAEIKTPLPKEHF